MCYFSPNLPAIGTASTEFLQPVKHSFGSASDLIRTVKPRANIKNFGKVRCELP
jgi:hypothetical protein